MYEERPSTFAGAVAWTNRTGPGGQRVLPDGCMDLLWWPDELLIAGPDTKAFVTDAGSPVTITGLRFAPGTGPAVFGVPAHALRDQRVPLAAVWPASEVRRLAEHVAAADDVRGALEAIAADRVRVAGPPEPAIGRLVAQMRAGRSVHEAAGSLGFSARQLQRRSLVAFGYGPKTLAMILRMERALGLARSGTPFATVAAVSGYADQAHLARDVRELAGVPLGQLIAAPAA